MIHHPTTPNLADERGWVMVTAMMLMTIMLALSFATMATVDDQQERTREQRERESSLNLAETALYQHGFALARSWPNATAPAIDCVSTTAAVGCPSSGAILSNSSNVDTKGDTVYKTVVRDNGGALAGAWDTNSMNAAQPGCVKVPCNYDANNDKQLWVQSNATVRGRSRSIVATLKLETLLENVPQTAVVAGGINTGNQGAQVKIYANGSQVVVRCTPPATTSTTGNGCVSDPGAIAPRAVGGVVPPLMTPLQIERFKERAKADKTYYPGCPPTGSGGGWNLTGEVVFVENCSDSNAKLDFSNNSAATCSGILPPKPVGAGNGLAPDCINTLEKPGFLIWRCGGFGTAGKGTFIGIMYFVNGSDGTCAARGSTPPNCSGNNNSPNNVLSTSGGLGFLGAVAIDGNGCLYASANGIQVYYDPNVFKSAASYGTVGLVQDTWRELIPR